MIMKKILILLSLLLSSTGLLKAAIYDTFEHDGLRYMIISEGDYYDYDIDPRRSSENIAAINKVIKEINESRALR